MQACGVRTDGTATCWGDTAVPVPSGTFTQVSAGFWTGCGIREDGAAACWGDGRYGETSPPAGSFTHIPINEDWTCGLRPSGDVVCWGTVAIPDP